MILIITKIIVTIMTMIITIMTITIKIIKMMKNDIDSKKKRFCLIFSSKYLKAEQCSDPMVNLCFNGFITISRKNQSFILTLLCGASKGFMKGLHKTF